MTNKFNGVDQEVIRISSFLKGCSMIIILIFLSFICNGQVNSSNKAIDSVKISVINFLRKNDNLEEHNSLKEYERRISIVEVIEKTILGYNQVAIYAFDVNTSHSKIFLLLKNKSKYKILDPEKLGATLQEVSDFFVEAEVTDAKMIEYVESVIRIYKMNEDRNAAKLEIKKNNFCFYFSYRYAIS